MSLSIQAIKEIFSQTAISELPQQLAEWYTDPRDGVKKLCVLYEKKYRNYLKEIERLQIISSFERAYAEKGFQAICGIDEVGRGPLAGPVVTSCVILPEDCMIEGINDSKKLSESKREQIFQEITNKAIDISVGIVDNNKIDTINILNATMDAMKQGIQKLTTKPDILLVDAVRLDDTGIICHPIIKGDERSISIAAASIIAKVTRDCIMDLYDFMYPQYDFKNNKGYGTKTHVEAIKRHGLTPIHRKSFCKNIEVFSDNFTTIDECSPF